MSNDCPLCGELLKEGEHYVARPEGSHTFHTDKKGIAKLWRYRSDMDVTPEPEPYEEGTIGYHMYMDNE